MTETRDSFFILTGGPGAGKTTLIEALRAREVACVEETGRRIIQTQRAVAGQALPWLNPTLYAEMEFGVGLLRYFEADPDRLTVFDRGILDPLGFLTVSGLPIPAHMREAARRIRYNRMVFVAPPWEEIYSRDTERKQSFAEAHATHEAMLEVYGQAGYRLLTLPCASVEARVAFVLDNIAATRLAIA